MHSKRAPGAGIVCVATISLASACAPSLPDDTALVTEPRLIAVRVDPPEASPGDDVTAHALVASPTGPVTDAKLDWAVCDTPKSPAENRSVDPACLTEVGSAVAEGDPVTLTVPSDACALFGPDTPPGDFRPRDADATGGYFLPIRVRLNAAPSIVLQRITCNPAGASLDVANALRQAHVPNRNPTLGPLTAETPAGVSLALDRIPEEAEVLLKAGFDATDEERYAALDPATGTLVVQRETLRFSFYATTGTFDSSHTGPAAEDATSAVTWHPGTVPGPAHLFVVLRDSRGGLDFSATTVMVVRN